MRTMSTNVREVSQRWSDRESSIHECERKMKIGYKPYQISNFINCINCYLQLRKYWKGADAPSSTDFEAEKSSAAGILGLGKSQQRALHSSLEHKVNTYLDDVEEGSGVLAYWQVSNSHSKH